MKRTSKRGGQETYGSGLTSGELTIGICVAIFVMAVALGTGILIGKFDPSLQQEATEESQVTDAPAGDSDAAPEATGGSGVQVTPKLPPRSQEASRTEPVTPPERPTAPPAVTPRVPDLPPLPPPGGASTATEESAPMEPEEPVEAPTEAVEVVEEQPAEVAPTPEPEEPEEQAPAPEETQVAAAKPVAPAEPVAKPATSAPGTYGVQLAAFTGTDGSKQATDYKTKINERLGYDARVFPSSDGKFYRVIAVGYSTKEEATKACKEIRKIKEFQEAWVQELPR